MAVERILLVENDVAVRESVETGLVSVWYHVTTESDGLRAEARFIHEGFDLIISSLELPGQDGLELCRRIRQRSGVPIIIVTPRSRPVDLVRGLEAGADDYITHPFELPELIARVRATLRSAGGSRAPGPIQLRDLLIDPRSLTVKKGERSIYLSATEFRLLLELATNRNQVLRRSTLMESVWEYKGKDSRAVDMAIRRLRSKVEEDPHDPRLIRTVRGVGYMLVA